MDSGEDDESWYLGAIRKVKGRKMQYHNTKGHQIKSKPCDLVGHERTKP